MKYYIQRYETQYEQLWDDFVKNKSVNGTFLHTRRFLNYHPTERFTDFSLIVFNEKNNISAIVPACLKTENQQRIFSSHSGSTFGGIVVDKKNYKTEKLLAITDTIENYLRQENIHEIFYKITSTPYCTESASLLEYILYYQQYTEYKELNLFVDLNRLEENIKSTLSQGKRTNVNNCIKYHCMLKKLETKEEIAVFYRLLCENLKKYNIVPVHTLEELYLLHFEILPNETEFYGIYKDDEMIAGSMMFYFSHVAHTQYLCESNDYKKLSPMSFMYYSMIVEMKRKGFDKLTWGIVTENNGKYLNMGLVNSKENFGSSYFTNYKFSTILSPNPTSL